jgi:hypothetical protein
MIRPFGYSGLDLNITIPSSTTNYAVAREEGLNFGFFNMLLDHKIPVMGVKTHYGGPRVLAQYKAYIELPYQVSTMKVGKTRSQREAKVVKDVVAKSFLF